MNVTPQHLRVYVGSKFGRRRVRVSECAYILKAEALYDQMVREGHRPTPGQGGQVLLSVAGRWVPAAWVAVANPIWRYGRVFLRCGRCGGRRTRLYLPLVSCALECRTCYGLTYSSRSTGNYHRAGGLLASALGASPGDWERLWTWERRQEARAAARVRYQQRWT